ncbi:MAG: GTPase [Gammaproteobacteria bacterium]|nr:MAG: GTPase [Gammaproteobacteria bacterium]
MNPKQALDKAIKVAVVGHTNSGKTSLLRTLLRDSEFGEVSDSAGTTRHVEGGAVLLDGEAALALYDTPGLEDSIGLLEAVEGSDSTVPAKGHQLLTSFISRAEQHPDFEQEVKVLRQLLADDLLFYVIDVREPVLGKYRDEMTLLSYAAKPIIPVLNFIASERARTAQWREILAQYNLHAQVDFDTVVFRFDDEQRLLRKMQSLLPARHDQLEALLQQRQFEWRRLRQLAADCCAELLLDCAAYSQYTTPDAAALEAAQQQLQQRLRNIEKRAQREVLAVFGFDRDDVRLRALPVKDGVWQADLFDASLLKNLGIDVGGGLAKGAAVGASLDVFTGGLSLGTATAVGAIAGALWSTRDRVGRRLSAVLNREHRICADDSTLAVLWHRQRALLYTVQSRGHASTTTTELAPQPAAAQMPKDFSKWLKRIRANPHWSVLVQEDGDRSKEREALLREISAELLLSLGES